ncbi:hypothetical protein [Geopsychrobacter electrodiphilus]|uniref:hypothetical protein n=1 Tax=Geopsychrobacter electrodiphilus TaxID=225196 RepID=UPI0003711D8F|nr:hypothetical protein [Geopsychrobacter electrodiphilus]
MSILAAILDLKSTLESDSALDAFCQARFGKSITVKTSYRNREEISMGECPVVLMTRPRVTRENGLNRRARGNHTVRLYFGFYQADTAGDPRDTANQTAIEFEEAIEDAVSADTTRGGNASSTVPKDSVNDEGILHPVYFGVMEIEITKRL